MSTVLQVLTMWLQAIPLSLGSQLVCIFIASTYCSGGCETDNRKPQLAEIKESHLALAKPVLHLSMSGNP